MGMAASQARFLGLTARKNNVEYEGQQINQQRTTLSNQSATYNNQLLGLNVPTAPSVESFTKTVYTWSENGGTTTNTITNMVPTPNSLNGFEITYTQPYTSNEGYQTADTASITYDGTNYKLGSKNLVATSTSELAALREQGDTTTNFLKYVDDNQSVSYFNQTELIAQMQRNDADAGNDLNSTNAATVYKIGAHTETLTKQDSVTIDIDASGRLTNLVKDGKNYALTAKSMTDEGAYNDAMSQYEYNLNVYRKTMNDINAKIDIIQSQDKNLELKLKQCDTEQEAISQEMDAVKKVTDKNIESTFKTFG